MGALIPHGKEKKMGEMWPLPYYLASCLILQLEREEYDIAATEKHNESQGGTTENETDTKVYFQHGFSRVCMHECSG